MKNKKAFIYGIAASFFFAFTFILNRNMHLSGGSWIWSACLRYFFTFLIMALIIWKGPPPRTSHNSRPGGGSCEMGYGFSRIHKMIAKRPWAWIIWSTVGFGFFYAPLSLAADFGESWLIAASWQMTIVMGILMTPLFHSRIPLKNLFASGVILFGVFLLQMHNVINLNWHTISLTLFPMLIAAISYPLGNRKMMLVCKDELSTIERIYGMTLCSLPFWFLLSLFGIMQVGLPSPEQLIQTFGSALFSGVIATILFFKATDLVKSDQKQLAVIESTQSGEVLFTLLGGILLLKDTPPDWLGMIGILFIVSGMILNSLLSSLKRK